MNIGKLTSEELEELIFSTLHKNRSDVLVRPNIGEDCAIIDFNDELCVMSTDPITGTAKEIGKLAVHISCNDIASSGAYPIGIMLTIMAPPETTKEEIKHIMTDASNEASKLNVDVIGGHTEITNAVNRIIICSTAIGKKSKEYIVEDVIESDYIVLTKGAGIEGTGIICIEKEEELKKVLSEELLNEGKSLLNEISVVKEGLLASEIGVSFMHDVTEGGILGAIWEVCRLSDKGCNIYMDKININLSTKKICEHYKIDPLRLISSGSMIIGIRKEKIESLKDSFDKNDIKYSIIGEITKSDMILIGKKGSEKIKPPQSDELYKIV